MRTRPARLLAGASVAITIALATATSALAQNPWAFGASGFLFDPPGEDAYFSPIVTADRATLHLEARYNYEDLETASVFAGWNFETGDDVVFTITPMAGLVFGNTNGAAPGAEMSVAWRALELYAESEYVIGFEEGDDNFLYAWVETTAAATGWLRAGIAAQRTRAYETALDVQRGVMLSASRGQGSIGAYWFNPDRDEDDLFVFAAGYEW